MIDARKHHDPALAPGLVSKALIIAGSQKELAGRVGVSREHIRKLGNGESLNMSYALQVALEQLAKEKPHE